MASSGASSARLPKAMRLKRQRLIRPLFDRRRTDVGTVAVGCVRLLYRVVPRYELDAEVPVQVGFAPGRRPTAVERNRIKRILREVYRVHQQPLVDLFSVRPDRALTLMILFRGKLTQIHAIKRDLPRALERIAGYLRADPAHG